MRRKIRTAVNLVMLVVLASAAVGVWRLGTMTSSACQALAPESASFRPESTGYFTLGYEAARQQFLEAARAAGARVESIRNPHRGPGGEPLSLDVALLGPENAQRTLVVSSGTHGVEGFAGSGIQNGLLREGIASRLPAGTNLLLIHAINPYGMAHLRRANEDNVDLNRNFRNRAGLTPENPAYEALADIIAPRSISFWSEVVAWSRLLWFRVSAGQVATQAAISGGQYSHQDGLFFGGLSDTWSNATIRSVLERYLNTAREVIVIDVHTGLGAFGAAEVILNVPKISPEYERAVAIWGPSLVRTTVVGESVSTHLEASLKLAIPEILPDAMVTAVSLEFGTFPPMEVFKALRAENWLHHHGDLSHPRAPELKACLLRAFHPDSSKWEKSVWAQGEQAVEAALAGLSR